MFHHHYPVTSATAHLDATAHARNYAYDPAGRLTHATTWLPASPTDPAECLETVYGFDVRGNRTSQTTSQAPACGGGVAATRTWSHDSADRVQTSHNNQGNYVYDALGRQTLVPTADTPTGGSDIALAYYDDDSAREITGDGSTTSYTLDAAGRRHQSTTTGIQTGTTTRFYTDTGDNPSWIEQTSDGNTETTSYETSIGGDLGVEATPTQIKLTLADPLGNIAATITLPAGGGSAQGIDNYTSFDEYGNPRTTTSRPCGAVTTGLAYGWLGAKQRATDNSGLLLMGARLYNPATGLFTSQDPVQGGNTTTYTYPQDPINKQDTTGRAWWDWVVKPGKAVGRAAKWVGKAGWSATKWVGRNGWSVAKLVGRSSWSAGKTVYKVGKRVYNSPAGKIGGKAMAAISVVKCGYNAPRRWKSNRGYSIASRVAWTAWACVW